MATTTTPVTTPTTTPTQSPDKTISPFNPPQPAKLPEPKN
jgi:hypothetical protein